MNNELIENKSEDLNDENSKQKPKSNNPFAGLKDKAKWVGTKAKAVGGFVAEKWENSDANKYLQDKIILNELKKLFVKDNSIELVFHLNSGNTQKLNCKIDNALKEIYSYELIKLCDISYVENKSLGKSYYILDIKEHKKVFNYVFKAGDHSFEAFIYEYSLEKPKEEKASISNTYHIEKVENTTTTLGKNAVMGDNVDASKKSEVKIEVSPTIKLPDVK